jgi:hypothetical protein
MLQSILKPTLFNDDEEVRPKNHPKKKIPDARRKNRDGGKKIGAADGEQPRLQIENDRNLLKLSVSEANLETKKGKRNTHTRQQLQKCFEKKQSMRSSLTCTRRRRFRASETRSRNWWSKAAERKKARPSPDPANKSSATSSKEIHVLKEMMSQETRTRSFFFFRLGSQMFRTWNNGFTPLGC